MYSVYGNADSWLKGGQGTGRKHGQGPSKSFVPKRSFVHPKSFSLLPIT